MPRWRIPYGVALAVAAVEEVLADYLTHRAPVAPLEGVRLAHAARPVTSERARQELGYVARDLEESLCDALAWCRQ